MKRAIAGAACLLAFSASFLPTANAHTIDPGAGPTLEDEFVFCHPGHTLTLAVNTAVGNAFAVWTYVFNPALGFRIDFNGIGIAHTDPDYSLVIPGHTVPWRVDDEILVVYVYGIAHFNPAHNSPAPLIGYPPDTHCN